MELPTGVVWEYDAEADDLAEKYDVPDGDEIAWRSALDRLRDERALRSLRFGQRLQQKVHGWTFGAWRSHNSIALWAEGRLAALVDANEASRRLAAPAELRRAAAAAARVWRGFGIEVADAPVAVRRLDLTAELMFADSRAGLALLRALEGVELPGCIADAWQRDGRVETIYYRSRAAKRGGGKVKFRVYDKGAELAARDRPDAPSPGRLIRFERQLRFEAQDQLAPEIWAQAALAPHFIGPFKGVHPHAAVLTAGEAVDAVIARVESGELSAKVGERLLGTLLLWQRLGGAWGGWSDKTAQRRRRELAEYGLSLTTDIETAKLSVPVGRIVADLEAAWATPPAGTAQL
jgi:hypothetical protein